MEIKISESTIGVGHPCFIIAEVAQAHDGSLGTAHAYIDAIANAGANAIKFQTHIASAESTPVDTFRVNFSRQDATRYEYWRRMEFTAEQWQGLFDHANERGLIFLSSAFSEQALDLLEAIGCPAWKVGSGEINSHQLLRRMALTKKPVLLSSGVSSWAELEEAVTVVRGAGAELTLFQCTTEYPCPPERWGINVIAELRGRFGCPVGLSDHSGNIYAGLAAVALGVNLLEIHVTFSHECFGPDVSSSVTTTDLKRLVYGVRQIELSLNNPVDKDYESSRLRELKTLFGKSIVAARDLLAGEYIKESDLAFKKPGTGIPASRASIVLGSRLTRSVPFDALITMDDLEVET